MKKTIFFSTAFFLLLCGSFVFISLAATVAPVDYVVVTEPPTYVEADQIQPPQQIAPSDSNIKVSTSNVKVSTTTTSAANTTSATGITSPTSAVSTTNVTDPAKKTVAPPPAYIQTHQTQLSPVSPDAKTSTTSANTSPASVSASASTSTSATTTEELPPPFVPQDIAADQGVAVSDFVVTSVVVTETIVDPQIDVPTAKVIEFQGKAKPNTYITLYIYSTPIIVTVKTDDQGNWKYNLEQELDDGVHRVYVAQIDNTGSVVAKSDPYFFTKAAASVQMVSSDMLPIRPNEVNFFQKYYIAIALAILVIAILISLTVIGLVNRKSADVVSEPAEPLGPSGPFNNTQ